MNFENTKQAINNLIDNNICSGAVIKILKDNKELFFESFGYSDIENKIKMEKENIFAMFSMTKPITVLSVLLLVDRGQLSLNDSIRKFFPNFKYDFTIHDALNMTSGISYDFGGKKSVDNLLNLWDKIEKEKLSLNEVCENLAETDWETKPNEKWVYGLNLDLIGGVIEKVTNMTFRKFQIKNIFEPLGMTDTDYFIKDEKRMTFVYEFLKTNETNKLTKFEKQKRCLYYIFDEPNACLGGMGLFSTASDYLNFLTLLVNKGEYNGKRLISSELIKAMSSDQIGELRSTYKIAPNTDYSYGYGVRVRTDNNLFPITEIGEYGWDGALGSVGIIDPKNKLVVTFLISSRPGNNLLVQHEIFNGIYKDIK